MIKVVTKLLVVILVIMNYSYLRAEDSKFSKSVFNTDTLNSEREKVSDLNEDNIKPGEISSKDYSPYQDSVFAKALRIKIPVSVRLHEDFLRFASKRKLEKELERGLPWQIALENLQIKDEYLKPLPQDIVHRDEMIKRSLYVPYMPNRIRSGLSVNIQDVGVILGILDDVSPVITFELKYTEEVEIVIYSTQATVISTIYDGILQPGSHKFVWNGRDEYGRPMPSGDYIGEVRIGTSRYVRKRIHLP